MLKYILSWLDICSQQWIWSQFRERNENPAAETWKLNTNKLQRMLNASAWVVSGTRKFDRGPTQLIHADLHWFDMPECIKYKLCMTMHQCQDGTVPWHLAVQWAPVSETASQQHLRSDGNHQLTSVTSADLIWWLGICSHWPVNVELTFIWPFLQHFCFWLIT